MSKLIGVILVLCGTYCLWKGTDGLRRFYFKEYLPKIKAYDAWIKMREE